MKLLQDVEWSHWSDREVAKHASVSHEFVRKLRPAPLTVNVDSEKTERTFKTKHGTVAKMSTAAIGKKPSAEPEAAVAPPPQAPTTAWRAQHERDLANG